MSKEIKSKVTTQVKINENSILSKGYGLAPKFITTHQHLTSEAKMIWLYLSSFCGNGNVAFPSRDLILHHLGMSKNRFYKHRELLLEHGLIRIEKNRALIEYTDGTSKSVQDNNTYILALDFTEIEKNKEIYKLETTNKTTKKPVSKQDKKVVKKTKSTVGISQFAECPQNEDVEVEDVQQKDSNNNSVKNNSFNNNISSSSSCLKIEPTEDEDDINQIYNFAKDNNFKLQRPTIKNLLVAYKQSDIIKAITICLDRADIKSPTAYLKTVLKDLTSNKTVVNNISVNNDNKANSSTSNYTSNNSKRFGSSFVSGESEYSKVNAKLLDEIESLSC